MSYPHSFGFDQELATAKRSISARVQHLKPEQRSPALAQLWVQWIKQSILTNTKREGKA
jgi:hypothetical protein